MPRNRSILIALLEVLAIFLFIHLALASVQAFALTTWVKQTFQRPFVEYTLVLLIPLALLIATRRDLGEYGLCFRKVKAHLEIAAVGFLPVAAASLSLNFLNWKRWDGALLVAAILTAGLVLTAWLLRRKPVLTAAPGAAALLFLAPGAGLQALSTGSLLLTFVFFFVFVAPAEELLFRGYIQARLNRAFGRPYRFMGVPWGWGAVASALCFGLWHVTCAAAFAQFSAGFSPVWPWAFWTFFLGLLLSFLREKTGSLIAPSLLHGVLNVL